MCVCVCSQLKCLSKSVYVNDVCGHIMREEQASPSLIDLLTLCVCVGMSFNFIISCCRPLSVFMTGVTACDPAGLHHAKYF